MDDDKCQALKAELTSQPEPQIAAIEQFFDGNDDVGSIGCNLMEHPGIETFHNVLSALQRRPDVKAVYAQISELDPGDGCWPFADTVFIVGTISPHELRGILSSLEPDKVGPAEASTIPELITQKHQEPVLAAWWD